ncbi:hypothetical protein NDU88_007258 [Pleurodeles waltl]|uniref:Uncharacterized protein n=1 Tax=Pleurodeles waltl TaxID=8319 RepID=A0AAV7NW79_PLEWA|nr:hypothetical protein NDU88_007258 [Pleurodeles waltl]
MRPAPKPSHDVASEAGGAVGPPMTHGRASPVPSRPCALLRSRVHAAPHVAGWGWIVSGRRCRENGFLGSGYDDRSTTPVLRSLSVPTRRQCSGPLSGSQQRALGHRLGIHVRHCLMQLQLYFITFPSLRPRALQKATMYRRARVALYTLHSFKLSFHAL